MQSTTNEILGAIRQRSDESFANALSLPPAIYHDEGILSLETKRIFRNEWICAGRLAEIPEPGDYFCRDIVDSPVVVIRQRDLSVKAFANVCAHRAAQLLSSEGSVTRICCPYHSWTYDLNGQLIGAPFMHDTPGFNVQSHKLNELLCDDWEGFIYVSLGSQTQPLRTRLASLSELVGDFRMANYVPVFSREDLWHTNWKCLVENFMDAYHIHKVHKDSFGKYSSAESQTKLFDGEDAFSYHYVQEDDEPRSIHAHPDNTWLAGDNRNRTYLINIFPSHTIQLQPDLLWYLSILPVGTGQLKVNWSVSIPAEILDSAKDKPSHIEGVMQLLHQVNSEDKRIVENLCKSTRSPDARRGPLSYLERNVWQFGRYLARQLN